jgi:hypothetical protein
MHRRYLPAYPDTYIIKEGKKKCPASVIGRSAKTAKISTQESQKVQKENNNHLPTVKKSKKKKAPVCHESIFHQAAYL